MKYLGINKRCARHIPGKPQNISEKIKDPNK